MSEVDLATRNKNKRLEEEKLIEKSLAGDAQAFAMLYQRYYSQIFSFCARLLRGKYDVEDAVQQVFLEAWRSLGRFEGRSLFSTWLTKIAIHTCLSFHRKTGRIVLEGGADSDAFGHERDQLWGQTNATPDAELLLREKQELVNKLLTRMTAKKKVVFMLSDMQGMTAPEISAILQIPDATVRTRLFHARREFASWVERNRSVQEVFDYVPKNVSSGAM
jgi:RNA polymerase sigma factor (sigma-70 family)